MTPRRVARRAARPVWPERRSVVFRSIAQFAAWTCLLLVFVVTATVTMVERVAQEETLRDARRIAHGLGGGVVAPMIDEGFRTGDPDARADVDRLLRARMQDGSITRIKLWDESGTVMWSDDPHLIGETFPLGPAQREALRTGTAVAHLSDLEAPENVHEAAAEDLLEVYAGLVDADGEPFLFEIYMPTEALEESRTALVRAVLPIAVGALLVVATGMLPLSVSLARRVDRAGVERERLLHHAVAAADLERRRMAQDLHDGVVQDLAALGYLLASTPAGGHEGAGAMTDETLRTALEVVQRDAASLRSLLTDLYPPDLDGPGLSRAIADLTEVARRSGIDVTCTVELSETLPPSAATLTYRVVREGLRNVVRHSHARHVQVVVRAWEEKVEVSVSDDGVGTGLDTGSGEGATSREREGHLGLRLLRDTVRDLGGEMTLQSRPGSGTTMTVRFAVVRH